MESSRPSRLASCYRITVYVVECESPHGSSQTMQQATNGVSQMGTEELVVGRVLMCSEKMGPARPQR